MNQTKTSDKIGKSVFAAAAVVSIISVVVIFGFLIAESIPALNKIGFFDFLFGNKWAPDKDAAYDQPLTGSYGIAYMIAGTFAATAGAREPSTSRTVCMNSASPGFLRSVISMTSEI